MTVCRLLRPLLVFTALLTCSGLAQPALLDAQSAVGSGLVVAVDLERRTLALETAGGGATTIAIGDVTILDDHGSALPLSAIRPGDAVSYRANAGSVSSLRVARQFWAVPAVR